jgi:hypothetical protein
MLKVTDTNEKVLKKFEFGEYELMELFFFCKNNGMKFTDAAKEELKRSILDFPSRCIWQKKKVFNPFSKDKLLAVTVEKKISPKELYLGLMLNNAIKKKNNIALFRTYQSLLKEGLKVYNRIFTWSLDIPDLNRHHQLLGFRLEKKDIINGVKYNLWALGKHIKIRKNKNREEI